MRSSAFVVVVSWLAGCTPPAAHEAARAPIAPAARSYAVAEDVHVLVWTDARLHRSPDDTSPVRAAAADPAVPRGGVYLARLLEERGAWRKIATGPLEWRAADGGSRHCAGNGLTSVEMALELWVRAEDVAPVLQAPYERRFPDGTSARLIPGTPVFDGKPWIHGFLLPNELPPASVGDRYVPRAFAVDDPKGFDAYRVATMKASLGGREVRWSQGAWDYSDPPFAQLDATASRLSVVGCGAVELAFHGVATRDEGAFGMIGILNRGRPVAELPAGTPLSWPGGGHAGVVVRNLALDEVPPKGELCFTVPVGRGSRPVPQTGAALEICAPRGAATSAEAQ